MNNLKTSEKGKDLIKEFEGLRLNSYQDSVGVWTIGYGHTGTAKPNQTITKDEAERLLEKDLVRFEAAINKYVTVPLTQNQFDALVSIVFNVGEGASHKSGIIRLKDGRPSTLLRRLNEGDYLGAAIAFKDWKYAGGRVLRGLERRREAEFQLFMG